MSFFKRIDSNLKWQPGCVYKVEIWMSFIQIALRLPYLIIFTRCGCCSQTPWSWMQQSSFDTEKGPVCSFPSCFGLVSLASSQTSAWAPTPAWEWSHHQFQGVSNMLEIESKLRFGKPHGFIMKGKWLRNAVRDCFKFNYIRIT